MKSKGVVGKGAPTRKITAERGFRKSRLRLESEHQDRLLTDCVKMLILFLQQDLAPAHSAKGTEAVSMMAPLCLNAHLNENSMGCGQEKSEKDQRQ